MDWLRRNRRKIAVGGGLVGGLYLVSRVVNRGMEKAREVAEMEFVERGRRHEHFASTEQTCSNTLATLLTQLREEVCLRLDTDRITSILKKGGSSNPEKMDLWQELKVLSFARCLAVVIGSTYLSLLLRTQLHQVAGLLYRQERDRPKNNHNNQLKLRETRLQQSFLQMCSHFLSTGVALLCSSLKCHVEKLTMDLKLHQNLALTDIEAIFTTALETMVINKKTGEDEGIFNQPGLFIMVDEIGDADLSPEEQDVLKQLIEDCLDILENQDTKEAAIQVCRQGLSHILDSVADYYYTIDKETTKTISQTAKTTSQTTTFEEEEELDSGFVSPTLLSLPLAKIIPILSAQVAADTGTFHDPWLTHLQTSPLLKTLGANVYEAFLRQNEEDDHEEGWQALWTKVQGAYWRMA